MAEQVTHASSDRYTALIEEIEEWLHQFPKSGNSFPNFMNEKKDELHLAFQNWLQVLPREQKLAFLDIVDQLVIQLATFFHKKTRCAEVENRILMEGRRVVPELNSISEMAKVPYYQLEYIEEKFKSKFQLLSLFQGGVSGLGHALTIALDFPILLAINLKIVQYIAGVYGYSMRSPKEQMIALHILYAVTLPKHYRQEAWEWIVAKLEETEQMDLLIVNEETMIQEEWLETLAKHWLKSMVLYGLNKGARKGRSLVGILLGANLNYSFTKHASQFASYLYRYRFLQAAKLKEERGDGS